MEIRKENRLGRDDNAANTVKAGMTFFVSSKVMADACAANRNGAGAAASNGSHSHLVRNEKMESSNANHGAAEAEGDEILSRQNHARSTTAACYGSPALDARRQRWTALEPLEPITLGRQIFCQ